MEILKRVANGYNKLLQGTFYLAGIIVIMIFVVVCWQVFARLLPIPPVLWTTDVAIYGVIILGFLGMAILLKNNAHVAIDVVVNAFPVKIRDVIGIITSVVGFATTASVTYVGLIVTVDQYFRGVVTLGSVYNLPKWILLAFIPFGFGLTGIEFLIKLKGFISDFRNKKKVL